MKLQESGEMYLETILILKQKTPFVRAIDIGDYMGYSKPSVSRAVSLLKNGGLITVEDSGNISLTQAGLEIASKIYERHTLLSDLLIRLGVAPETAVSDACKIEHVISDDTFNAIKRHTKS